MVGPRPFSDDQNTELPIKHVIIQPFVLTNFLAEVHFNTVLLRTHPEWPIIISNG